MKKRNVFMLSVAIINLLLFILLLIESIGFIVTYVQDPWITWDYIPFISKLALIAFPIFTLITLALCIISTIFFIHDNVPAFREFLEQQKLKREQNKKNKRKREYEIAKQRYEEVNNDEANNDEANNDMHKGL